jgi:integrase
MQASTRHAVRLMMLTFVRTSELIKARWNEFDLEAGIWTIPAARMKGKKQRKENGPPHTVPLSSQSLAVLKAQFLLTGEGKWGWVFPSRVRPDKPMSNNAILKVIERMGYKGRMTGHGFRAVASTALNEMGFSADVIEKALAHAEPNKIRASYNRAEYVPHRKELMQAWADRIDAIASGGQVIPINFRQQAGASPLPSPA